MVRVLFEFTTRLTVIEHMGHVVGSTYLSPSELVSLPFSSLRLLSSHDYLVHGARGALSRALLSLIYRRISNQETARDRWKLY